MASREGEVMGDSSMAELQWARSFDFLYVYCWGAVQQLYWVQVSQAVLVLRV